jgi:hypothetical protein
MLLVQCAIVSLWTVHLILQLRRLVRLAHIEGLRRWEGIWLRSSLSRLWWWLGQEKFWKQTQHDTVACAQLTIMLVLMTWSLST